MKKKVLFLILVLGLCFTGCSKEKKLECSSFDKSDLYYLDNITTVTLKNDKITKIKMEIYNTINDKELKKKKKTYFEKIRNLYDGYDDLTGVNVLYDEDGYTLSIVIEGNVSAMDDEAKKTFNLSDPKTTYDDLKKNFEDKGYICK